MINLNVIHTGSVFNTNSDWIEAVVAGLSLDHWYKNYLL
jgi:hypothetical protein